MQDCWSFTCSFLEPLAHRLNVASLSLFCRYYFGKCLSELAQLVPLPYFRGRSTPYSDRLHNFSVTVPKCYKDVYVNNFFPRTAGLRNSLFIKCFPLTYDLNGFNLETPFYLEVLSKQISCMPYPFCTSFSCNFVSCSGCQALYEANPS